MELKSASATAAALVALCGFAGPATASTNPNGRIAYEVCDYSLGPYQCDIWAMDADGSNAVNLTNTADVSETGPVWSPDGSRIATGGFDGQVRLFDAKSGNLVKQFVPVPITAPTATASKN